jgi:hypothetical protein
MEYLNGNDVAIHPELHLDMDLVTFIDKQGVTYLDLLCYHSWRRGFDRSDIARDYGISEEEEERAIHSVQRLLSPETLTVDRELRDEILAIKSRAEERKRQVQELSSKSAQEYLQEGRDPATVMRELRQCLNDDLTVIADLRTKDIQTNIDEEGEARSLQDDLRNVAKLRNEAKGISRNKRASEANPESDNDKGTRKSDGKKQRRISIRLDDATFKKLEMLISNREERDFSKIVRRAVNQFLREANPKM